MISEKLQLIFLNFDHMTKPITPDSEFFSEARSGTGKIIPDPKHCLPSSQFNVRVFLQIHQEILAK